MSLAQVHWRRLSTLPSLLFSLFLLCRLVNKVGDQVDLAFYRTRTWYHTGRDILVHHTSSLIVEHLIGSLRSTCAWGLKISRTLILFYFFFLSWLSRCHLQLLIMKRLKGLVGRDALCNNCSPGQFWVGLQFLIHEGMIYSLDTILRMCNISVKTVSQSLSASMFPLCILGTVIADIQLQGRCRYDTVLFCVLSTAREFDTLNWNCCES
jgi:hypothetical protein